MLVAVILLGSAAPANGTITTDGLLYNVPGIVSVGAITGGTGRYRGVKGEATVDLGSPCGPHHVTFALVD